NKFYFPFFYLNNSEDRYLSPLSHTTLTTIPFSSSSHSLTAAEVAPPLLIPAKTPSLSAKYRVICIASSSLTSMILSIFAGLKILGRYSFCHFLIPGIFASSAGCTPTIWIFSFCSFKKVDVPIIVPVVPIEDTKWVISLFVSLHISGPVVL